MENRPSIHEVLMRAAMLFAERSTCVRIQTGAVIAIDNRIVSTGYNGNAPGHEHCYEHFRNIWAQKHFSLTWEEYVQSETFKEEHREWSLVHELHGEANAIIYAAKKGTRIEGGTLYTTYSPCLSCMKSIISAGIVKVFYHTLYDRPEGRESLEILKENDIEVFQILAL
jgi:dCMP deaminase